MFDGTGHQVTFDGVGNGASGLGMLTGEGSGKVLHNAGVTTTVATAIGANVDDPLLKGICLAGNMMANDNLTLAVVSQDLTMFAHNVNIPMAGAGLCSQREGGSGTIFEIHDDAHMVADIVVAPIDAAAIGAGLQSFQQRFFRLLQTNHICRPTAKAGGIRFPGIEAAGFSNGTLQTPLSRAGRCVILLEIGKTAKGSDLPTVGTGEPEKNIQVMAALLHDDWAA